MHQPKAPGQRATITRLGAITIIGALLLTSACSRRTETGESNRPGPTAATVPVPSTGEPADAGSTPASALTPPVPVRPAVAPAGRITDGTLHTPDGRDRTYHVYVPASLPAGTPVPLLVALHGGSGWGTQFEANSGFDGIAEANRFVVVYPDGTKVPLSANSRVWNGGDCCGAAEDDRDHVDDVGFISAVIDQVEATEPIDRSRVYAAGHSNGAIMAYRLACQLSDKIVAIGIQAGVLGIPSCRPTRPVSVLHIHGEADRNIPLDGGKGDRSLSQTDFPPPIDAVHTLSSVDGCPSGEVTVKDPSNADLTTHVWQPCTDGTAVELLTVAGAGHAWMGHAGSTALAGVIVGPPYMGLDSSAQIWAFLAAHPRP